MVREKRRALVAVFFTYVAAFVVGAAVVLWLRDRSPVERALWADAAATLFVFVASRLSGNSSMYDPYWSLAPPVIVLFWIAAYRGGIGAAFEGSSTGAVLWLSLLLLAFVVWSVRLTANWVRRWHGFGDEDWRYGMLKGQFGRAEIVIDFIGVHFFPTLIVFVGLVPVAFALQRTASMADPFSMLTLVAGGLLLTAAIGLEWVADNQLAAFRSDPSTGGKILRTGIWGVVRHPNYIGEMLFWWGVWALSYAAGVELWTLVGPVAMTAMFLGISIPMMNRRLASREIDAAEAERNGDASVY
ncbi:MAG: DUF1295 domain-containing protein [Spirochaetales bacterium]